MLGQTISHYRIEEKLGEGGMGVVYRARDLSLNRSVAIKFLSSKVADEDRRRRFQQEAQTASSLNHPHILTVYEAGALDGQQYLVTEFIDGWSLREWAQREQPAARQMLDLLVGVADGLACAHQAGIVHRDIKPENILVSKQGYAKLVDFGLAKVLETPAAADGATKTADALTRAGAILGTVAYMSPEQAAGRPIDARSDIFAFGVVLYELLAGARPFAGKSDIDVLHAILHSQPQPLQAAPELRLMVEKALEKDPADRYQWMRDMVVDLKRAQRLKSAETAVERAPTKPRRRRWGIAAGIAAVLLAAAAATVWRLWQKDYFWENPLAGARIERLTDFEGNELDAAISPDGKITAFLSDRDGQVDAWVSQIGSGEFVNITKGQFAMRWVRTASWVGFSGDGAQVWFAIEASRQPLQLASRLAPSMGGASRPFLDRGVMPAWSPDGSKIAYQTTDPGDPLFIADRTGNNPKQIFVEKRGVHCHFPTWSLDGRHIYFVRGLMATEEMDIWRIPSAGQAGPERITRHNARVAYPAWLDSRTLIYAATAEDGSGDWLYAMDVEHRIPHRVSSGIAEQYLSVSASNTGPRRLVATVATPGASLWTVPFSDHPQTEDAVKPFPMPAARALGLRFGPDYFVYLSSKGGGDGLWKLEKGAARELWKGSEGGVVAPPAVSPDGRQICFSYRKQGRAGLYLMSVDGTNIRALTESLDVRGAASWSPDGKWIAVAANQGEGTRVFKVPVEGGQPVRLLDTLSFHPLWSPDGDFIVYSEPRDGGIFLAKAITPDKAPVPLPEILVNQQSSNPYRFVPGRKELVYIKSVGIMTWNFSSINLETRQDRRLTDLKPGREIHSFDVSPDGKQIVFDRLRENADIVLMELKR